MEKLALCRTSVPYALSYLTASKVRLVKSNRRLLSSLQSFTKNIIGKLIFFRLLKSPKYNCVSRILDYFVPE